MPRVYEGPGYEFDQQHPAILVDCDDDRERFVIKHRGDPVNYRVELRFGKGPNGDDGFNGVTEAALLAVVLERLVGMSRAAFAANPETALEHLRRAAQATSAALDEVGALHRATLLPPPKLTVVEPFHQEEVSAELPRDLATATKPVGVDELALRTTIAAPVRQSWAAPTESTADDEQGEEF